MAMANTMRPSGETDNHDNAPARTHKHFKELGIKTIPIDGGQRNPGGMRALGWQNRQYTEDDFFPNDNVGMQFLGTLACIDGDNPRFDEVWHKIASANFPQFLTTVKEGRKHPNHYIAHITEMPTGTINRKMVEGHGEKHGKMLVEVLHSDNGEGKQALIPPSFYNDGGGRLLWGDGSEFGGGIGTLDWETVRRDIGWCCAVAELSYYWVESARHQIAMALSGLLLNHEWGVEQVSEFMHAVASLVKDDQWGDREKTIQTTRDRIDAGDTVVGGKTLCALLGYGVVRNLCDWLGVDGGDAVIPVAVDGCPTLSLSEVLYCFSENEAGDALLFQKLMLGNCLYDLEEKDWYVFDRGVDRYWKRDHGYARHFITEEVAAAYDIAADHLEERLKEMEDGPTKKDFEGFIASIHKRISSLKTLRRATSVLSLASGHKEMQISHDEWNPDLYLLCVKNGVLDMRTGTLRVGMPEDHQRFACPTVWLGIDHPAPVWQQSLKATLDGRTETQRKDLVAFLQRFLGSGCVGAVLERRFATLFGERGQNGKDVLISGVSYALGDDVSSPISKEILLKQRNNDSKSADPNIADLEGKRLVWASEPDQGERFDVGQVKWLTGGGKLKARRLYENGHTFTPSHTLLLLTNHKPHAPAEDGAFWDRVFLIEFFMHFTTQDKIKGKNDRLADPHLEEKLKAEASGILAWLVRGCMEWLKVGFNPPAEVIASVDAYQKEEDTLAVFEEAVLESAEGEFVYAQELFNAYDAWAFRLKIKYPMNGITFGKVMKTRHPSQRKEKGMAYLNIRLKRVVIPNDGKIHFYT